MTAEVINAKQGLTRIPTYAELIKEIDREKFKTNDIRKIFDRNAWYFHESPIGQALNTNNIHPADLQQMNFKKMAEEATARKEEETPNLDFEDLTDLRDDAISDFEMSFDREAELREENERRVAEQANLSHSQDHYMANKGTYDAVGATASAGIKEDEEPPSSSRSVLRQFLKSSKPVIKAVATAGGTAKGGSIGGLIASKLTDAIIPDEEEEEKPSKIKPTQKLINKQVKKINHQKKLKEETSKMNVDVVPDANEAMDTTAIPTAEKRKPFSVRQSKAKRRKPKPPTQEKREFQEDPSTTTKPPKARRVRGKQPQPQALGATINIPKDASAEASRGFRDNKTPNVDEAETAQEETGASSSSKAPVRKPTMSKAISPSKVGIQVIREKFEEMNNSKNIDTADYQKFQEVYGQWKSSKGEEKKQHLKEAKELYKSIIYPKLKSK